jgi:hypothetical protein
MSVRLSTVLFVVLLLLSSHADAKNKKKQLLPDDVLRAETILVVIHPDAGEPLISPTANRTAQEDVEKAIMRWGRFRLVMESSNADLVIVVRKGHASGPTIKNSPADNRPVILEPTDGGARVGVQHGPLPDPTYPGVGRSGQPGVSNEVGPSEDMLEVYRGGVGYSLDSAPVWRYMAKDALNGPKVDAVEQSRKAIAESEEQRRQKQKP